jgi:hypothetical protein
MIKVYCCLWGDKYNRSFVETLKYSIAKHLSKPHQFYCLTDNPTEPYDIPIQYLWLKGMFIKMSLFERTGPSLYFDLDVEINESIDFLAEDFEGLTVVNSENWKELQSDFKFAINRNTLINTSVMKWSDQRHIFERFKQHRDMYLRIYQATDRFLYNERLYSGTFDKNRISSWKEGVEKNTIMLYNGRYNGQRNSTVTREY